MLVVRALAGFVCWCASYRACPCFFQAEDGIRDLTVTGVQTCALPISEGTIVNPRPPAPVSCRTATIKRIADTILGALVRALPGKMPAASSGTLLVMAFGEIGRASCRERV